MARGRRCRREIALSDVRVLFTVAEIAARVDALVAKIVRTIPNDFVMVGLLKGAVVFVTDRARAGAHPRVHAAEQLWSRQREQRRGAASGRYPRRPRRPAARCCSSTTSSITSRSIAYASAQLRHRGVGDLWTCALLDKRQRREVEVALHFVGFSVADLFVVGLRHRLRREVSPSALYRRRRVNGARSIIAPGPRKKGEQP